MCDFAEDFDDSYYADSDLRELLNNFSSTAMELVKEDIKQHYDLIKQENTMLKKEIEKFVAKELDLARKEREIGSIKQDLEKNFLKMKFNEATKNIFSIGYKAISDSFQPEKCQFCDDERKIEYTAVNGAKIKENCSCAKYSYIYHPAKYSLWDINILKKEREQYYLYGRYVTDNRETAEEVRFEKTTLKDKFIPEQSKYHDFYATEEECQKYCDELNKEK